MEVEVAIIGAGPAGSTLATLLARRGVAVALIDRDTFPREKVCGEFLSYDALPVLEALGIASQLDRLGATSIHRCRVETDGRAYEFALPAVSRGISRHAFDAMLFQTAVAAGIQRFDGWTADLDPAGTIVLKRAEETVRISPKVIVGAWGRWGRFDQVLGRSFIHDRAHRFFGFQRHYRGTLESSAIELHSFRRGYLGVAMIEGARINICGLVHQSRIASLRGGWASFASELGEEDPGLARLFSDADPTDEQFHSSEPVVFVPKTPVEGGIFMVGDAAGLIDPLTGNGMAIALQSAVVAAPDILAHLRSSRTAAETYIAAFSNFFGRRLQWSRRIAWLLCRPALLRSVLRARPPSFIGTFLTARTRADDRQLDRAIREWFAPV